MIFAPRFFRSPLLEAARRHENLAAGLLILLGPKRPRVQVIEDRRLSYAKLPARRRERTTLQYAKVDA
jgi:hypothetical protein